MEEINYQEMSVEELDAKLLELSQRCEDIRQEALVISTIRDQKVVQKRAEEKIAAMSPLELAAMAQIINAQSIA